VGASVVGGGVAEATQSAAGTAIRVAAAHRQPIDTVVRLELDGPAGTLAPR
jgi:hypothetical protein